MKRASNLYDKITNLKLIKTMYDKRVKLNTKNKLKIEKFDEYYSSNILRIKEILDSKNYKPGKYNLFLIKEPKVRLIMSQNIPDKIINHLVSQYFLVDVFDKCLIEENVATRINKGTHYGVKKLKQYLKNNIDEKLYVLKFDITKYFFNLDHNVLKKIIRKKIKDKEALKILDTIIESTDDDYINKEIVRLKQREILKLKKSNAVNKEQLIEDINQIPLCKKGKSAPIGNMSSQAFAIIYLNELDHYIKEVLKPGLYIRYQDDGLLVSKNKEYLKQCLKEIDVIVRKYKLNLNRKTRIYSLDEGFEFLGFKYIKKNNKLIMKIKNQTKKRFKRKMNKLYKLYIKGIIEITDVNQVKASYLGHLRYGNTNNLIKSVINRYEKDKYMDYGKTVIIKLNGELEIK